MGDTAMDQPLVSIILPVYNAQNHLARCIGSILDQTYKNIELIILNDGSKDHSLPVCEEFRAKDSRIVLVDKENSGVSDTRNLGLKLAGGEYVQFVDSDDYIDPDFTQHLVEAAETHHADLVIAPYKMVIPAGATKPEQVLEKLEDNLGVMSVARPPEVREYGFLPAGPMPASWSSWKAQRSCCSRRKRAPGTSSTSLSCLPPTRAAACRRLQSCAAGVCGPRWPFWPTPRPMPTKRSGWTRCSTCISRSVRSS